VAERITKTQDILDKMMDERNIKLKREDHSYAGLRFLSLLLGFRYPHEYNAIKPREWKVFSKYVDEDFSIPPRTTSGEQYLKFEPRIDAVREYIKTIPQIRNLKAELTKGLTIQDEEFRWMAQTVIYVTARVLASKKSGEPLPSQAMEAAVTADEETEISSAVEMEFPLEKYLEHFIIKNWKNIDFGEPLDLYEEEDGTIGEQYTTEVGIIDILARDKKGNFVVIELKRGASNQSVIGQILSYIGWVSENLATNGQKVRGIVIVSEGNKALLAAQRQVADKVIVKYYRVGFDIIEPK